MEVAAGLKPELPFRIGKYDCRKDLGGNMADVYLAWDPIASRPVVVKILRPVDAQNDSVRTRFIQEAQLACRCSHPNVITTYDVGDFNGRPYIVMEWLGGESLRSIMNRGGLRTPGHIFTVALQVARALGYLHTRGIIHRDVKPGNVHVDDEWQAKLLDFGVARRDSSDLTQAGQIVGTLAYMGPEQMQGEKPTSSVDTYAFGVMLFEMLTNRLPYAGETDQELAVSILYKPPDLSPLNEQGVPASIVALIQRCLAKKPDDRYPNFQPVVDTLKAFAAVDAAPATNAPLPQAAPVIAEPVTRDLPRATASNPARNPWSLIVALLVVLFLIVGASVWWFVLRPHAPAPLIHTATGDMVLVPAGGARLGETASTVRQVPAFYIDKTEVSNAAWARFCAQTHRPSPLDASPDLPVVNVSFNDVVAFASWAHKRLPTAAEWEKAARGATGQRFPWGDAFRPDAANLLAASGQPGHLEPVGSHSAAASPFGALNFLGNAWEWVATPASAPRDDAEFARYAQQYFGNLTPPLSRDEPWYQIRGGSYADPPADQAARLVWDFVSFPARARQNDVGFRCAADVSDAASIPRK